MLLAIVLATLLSVLFGDAAIPSAILRRRPTMPRVAIQETNSNATSVFYFTQLIDHNKPSLGTFQQRYWMNREFYETGGPIVLMTPGEDNADQYLSYLTNKTLGGMIAQQQCGASVILEHRFFGYSNPYNNLTSQSLEVLTIQQAIDDLVYFAQNVNLPMPGGDNVKPDTTPWILIGASYSGALTSWTMVNKPGIFRAGYASSAVVEAITDFYGYFTPIREYMPQNCSSDIQGVTAYLDQMYADNNTDALQSLKESFGLGGLSHIDDFAGALEINLGDWQGLQPYVVPNATFFDFCDALEVKNGVSAPSTGWGLKHAIDSWGSYWKNTYYTNGNVRYTRRRDMSRDIRRQSSGLQAAWTNVTVDNAFRSWYWMVCNQIGFYQTGPPEGQPAIVSRILKPAYFERQCVNMFPAKFSSLPTPSVTKVNTDYNGWNVSIDRLFFANGLRDPWREATVSADGLNKTNTTMQPIYESDGFHGSDMVAKSGIADETVRLVQNAALEYMSIWLA